MMLQVRRAAEIGGIGPRRTADLLDLIDETRVRNVRPRRAASARRGRLRRVAPGWELEVEARPGGAARVRLAHVDFVRVPFDDVPLPWWSPTTYGLAAPVHPDVAGATYFGAADAAGAVDWGDAALSAAAEAAFDALWEAHATRTPAGLYVLGAAQPAGPPRGRVTPVRPTRARR